MLFDHLHAVNWQQAQSLLLLDLRKLPNQREEHNLVGEWPGEALPTVQDQVQELDGLGALVVHRADEDGQYWSEYLQVEELGGEEHIANANDGLTPVAFYVAVFP